MKDLNEQLTHMTTEGVSYMSNPKIWAFRPPSEDEVEAFNKWLGIEKKKEYQCDKCIEIQERDEKIERYEKVLKEISQYPKVRGIGGFETRYNTLIEMALTAIRRK